MDIILCHATADFDSLGGAVGLTRLLPRAQIVLTDGCHPTVREFLALYRDEYPLIEQRAINPEQIRSLFVVDTQRRNRLGKAAQWLELPQLAEIVVYDHHLDTQTDIPATRSLIEPVGATTTLIVEQLQAQQIHLTTAEATVMALGIHVDTGSLTFDQATPRDAKALAWLMQQGASLRGIADYVEPNLSSQLRRLLSEGLENLHSNTWHGYKISWVLLNIPGYVPGLSSLTSRLMELSESEALLLGAWYTVGETGDERLTVIGRTQIPGTDLNQLFQPLGGGGHPQAASVTKRGVEPLLTLEKLLDQFKAQIPQPLIARHLMSSPVRTIRPETTIGEAQRILLRYGHSGLCVVNEQDQLVGIISRRDIDIALHHGFSHAPVKGYMTTNLKTINPETTLSEIQSLMVTYNIGRLPVLENSRLLGIVTRTDVLRELYQSAANSSPLLPSLTKFRASFGRVALTEEAFAQTSRYSPISSLQLLQTALAPPFWELLTQAAKQAEQRGWHLYLVGGAVRDLLLAPASPDGTMKIADIDLVVDGFHRSADVGAGIELALALQKLYPAARLESHGAFQTAALLWHEDEALGSLWVDIATARTEFYPYPAANPEVEASSIRQDLYRRDFTINALALRLTPPRAGEILDFFGGLLDLQAKRIRVLHANSFIEDPTRIYRAVRFAVRLGFEIELQTEEYIRYAIASGIYDPILGETSVARPALQTRLRAELQYILQAPYWQRALRLLAALGALKCIHPTLELDRQLWQQLHLLELGLMRFDTEHTLTHWLLRLEVLIAHLKADIRAQVAKNLQLPVDSIKRLQALERAQAEVKQVLPMCQWPSQVVQQLHQYDLPMLILIALLSPRSIRRQIWQYQKQWTHVQPPLNGNDLKALGYKPGPQYRQILEQLLTAKLDGVISDRSTAVAFLSQYYPLSSN
ncbi:MAG: CBS domain-containing protein [Chroococcidiopsidaceae cyanobacterium CP_BM_RX_35]|nr:CBS domain-containing protein [Chroococcidiopsidaceae cyanobacterium CP_BM_RX_35]